MNRRLALAIAFTVSSLIVSNSNAAQQRPADEKAERVQIVKGPALESATENSAIVRWATNTGGGTVVHYGVVRYGTDPKNLSETAKSRNRWNKNLPDTTYRVRVDGLKPETTYYYTVESVQANAIPTGARSTVNQFTTRQHP